MAAQQASGGDGGVISAKQYVDVKVDGVRSDLQASIAELRAEVKGLAAKIEALPTTWMVIGTIAGGFAVSLGLLFTFLTYRDQHSETARAWQMQMDRVAVMAEQTATDSHARDRRLDRISDLVEQNSLKISELSERVDRLVETVEQDARKR